MVEEEDCPICFNPLSKADQLYPLHCPTATCTFQFCCDCLQKLLRSASDGYSVASDGSNQVKVSLRCPICRGSYKNVTDAGITMNTELLFAPSSPSAAASSIVTAVLKLRQAASTPLPGDERYAEDSELTATELSARHAFLQETSLKELQDSVAILQHYHDTIDVKDCGTVPLLNWEAWRPFLLQHQKSSSPGNKNSTDDGDDVLPRDPTLFMGLEDLLSMDEQEFITSMMVSGKAETVAQAAHLLHSIIEMAASRNRTTKVAVAAASVQQQQRSTTLATAAQIEHQQKVRKRFPLPPCMPRAVALTAYNPLGKSPPLKFVKKDVKQQGNAAVAVMHELTLAGVGGPAGKVGLRKGDVVTHVFGDAVKTFGEFTVAMQQLLLEEQSDSVQITVNANDETARRLRERAQEMKKQGIRFH